MSKVNGIILPDVKIKLLLFSDFYIYLRLILVVFVIRKRISRSLKTFRRRYLRVSFTPRVYLNLGRSPIVTCGYGGVENSRVRLTNLPLPLQSSQRAIWGQQQKPKLRSISQTSPRRKLSSAPSVSLSLSHCRV